MITAMITSVLLVTLTVFVHYEALRLTSYLLPKLPPSPRARMLLVIFASFAAHTIEVWIYAGAYHLLVVSWQIGTFNGDHAFHFSDFLYFSTVTYTSVGYGDILPVDHMRLIAGVEALNGLLMIAWTGSFTYLVMEKLWPLHLRRRERDQALPQAQPQAEQQG